MSLYFYKKEKRVKRVSEDSTSTDIQNLKDLGYVQVLDRRNPEGSVLD